MRKISRLRTNAHFDNFNTRSVNLNFLASNLNFQNRQFSDKEIKSPGIHGKRNVSRTTTKEEIKNFEKSNLIRRQSSLRSEPSIKRHSLFEPPITKPMSFDTMSVRNLPLSSTESVQTPSPREENPPPRPPPRDPRANLVSAPPVITQQSKFNFDDPLSRVMNMSASRYSPVPQTPATAPPRSMTSDNGVQNFEPMQSSAPPPIPPRDRVNGAYAERTSVHAKSVDRSSPPSAPPPIPPRDPVRHAPRSMDVFNLPQHTNGRYVADPTQERISSAMHANSRRCLVSAQSFDSVHSYPDRDVWSGSTPSVFSEQRQAPFRTGWQDNHSGFHVNESVNNARFDNSSDNEVPPPVPRRQPSSAGTT